MKNMYPRGKQKSLSNTISRCMQVQKNGRTLVSLSYEFLYLTKVQSICYMSWNHLQLLPPLLVCQLSGRLELPQSFLNNFVNFKPWSRKLIISNFISYLRLYASWKKILRLPLDRKTFLIK